MHVNLDVVGHLTAANASAARCFWRAEEGEEKSHKQIASLSLPTEKKQCGFLKLSPHVGQHV